MFRRTRCAGVDTIEVLLVHPGGPFWRHKDAGAWTIPKGLVDAGEDVLAAAKREFREETGIEPCGDFIPLGHVRQRSGKTVHAWAFEGTCDPSLIRSNTFTMEWPPRSGRFAAFAEIDRAVFASMDEARQKINPGQQPLLDRLCAWLARGEQADHSR